MKHILTTLILFALTSMGIQAQVVPAGINFQGIAREADADIEVEFRLIDQYNLLHYAETQKLHTNEMGAFSAQIGEGERTAGNTFDFVDWTMRPLRLSVSINGATPTICNLLAVPYAKVAKEWEGEGDMKMRLDNITTGLANTYSMIDEVLARQMTTEVKLSDTQSSVVAAQASANDAKMSADQAMMLGQVNKMDVEVLDEKVATLTKEVNDLQRQNDALILEVADLQAQNAMLMNKVAALEAKVDELMNRK